MYECRCYLRVFEAALAGGGAKSINFQELAADLAEITFKFPFRIPPYFALVIRAISVLEGIALVGNPEVLKLSCDIIMFIKVLFIDSCSVLSSLRSLMKLFHTYQSVY